MMANKEEREGYMSLSCVGNYERHREQEGRPASSKSAKYLSFQDEGEGDFLLSRSLLTGDR